MKLLKFPILMRSCWFGLNYLFREKISSCPITTVQYTVLRTLFEANTKKLNQKELASLIATNKNNLSSIVKRLEVLKYILFLPNPEDKRENIIKITAKGEKVFCHYMIWANDLSIVKFAIHKIQIKDTFFIRLM